MCSCSSALVLETIPVLVNVLIFGLGLRLGLGLGLTKQDFTRVIKTPKDFLLGLVCQLIILPILTEG